MTDSSRVRVSIVGVVVIALFSALLTRLWFLQVASGTEYVEAARENSVRVVQTEAPRGRILDRDGDVLVDNRVAWAVTVERDLGEDDRELVLGRLSELLAVPVDELVARVDDPRVSLFKPAVVAVDVPERVRIAIREHREDFPGVDVEALAMRVYPNGPLAAHVLGYVGEINEEELAEREGSDYQLGDTIGRAGVERAYEDVLRGRPRQVTVEVDPAGNVVGDPTKVRPARPGRDVRLTLDLEVQRVAEESLRLAIEDARTVQNPDVEDRYANFAAPGGSVVVLDVRDGSVVAMASYPTFDPTLFLGGIPTELWEFYNNPANSFPLTNRATQGQYAPGSTFKLVTSVAAMRFGLRGPNDWITDNGSLQVGDRRFHNAGGRAYGSVDLRRALTVSSDVYFYGLGAAFWSVWDAGDTERGYGIQATAREFGLGATTGVPLPEADGRVPDAEWKLAFARELHGDDPEALRDFGGWFPGDEVNLSVGQGDLLVTPLQLANAYATFANGGTRWEPRVAAQIVSSDGEHVRPVRSRELGRVEIPADQRTAILDGLKAAVREGTAAGAFAGFPLDYVPVAGKTGTAQVRGKGDTSLFAGFYPADAPQYLAVAVVEEAGFGSAVAAPVVRRVIEALAGLPLSTIDVPETEVAD